ncbi:hypothetical protein SNEBB_000316 [Seison nebaliae]|nr:hypothetical protein SNEBB_000316 [Seison nebaliae]
MSSKSDSGVEWPKDNSVNPKIKPTCLPSEYAPAIRPLSLKPSEKALLKQPTSKRTINQLFPLLKIFSQFKRYDNLPIGLKLFWLKHLEIRHFGPGRLIIRAGHKSSGIFYVLAGKLNVFFIDEDEPIDTIGEDYFFGLSRYISVSRTCTIITRTAVSLLAIHPDNLRQMTLEYRRYCEVVMASFLSKHESFKNWTCAALGTLIKNSSLIFAQPDDIVQSYRTEKHDNFFIVINGKVDMLSSIHLPAKYLKILNSYKKSTKGKVEQLKGNLKERSVDTLQSASLKDSIYRAKPKNKSVRMVLSTRTLNKKIRTVKSKSVTSRGFQSVRSDPKSDDEDDSDYEKIRSSRRYQLVNLVKNALYRHKLKDIVPKPHESMGRNLSSVPNLKSFPSSMMISTFSNAKRSSISSKNNNYNNNNNNNNNNNKRRKRPLSIRWRYLQHHVRPFTTFFKEEDYKKLNELRMKKSKKSKRRSSHRLPPIRNRRLSYIYEKKKKENNLVNDFERNFYKLPISNLNTNNNNSNAMESVESSNLLEFLKKSSKNETKLTEATTAATNMAKSIEKERKSLPREECERHFEELTNFFFEHRRPYFLRKLVDMHEVARCLEKPVKYSQDVVDAYPLRKDGDRMDTVTLEQVNQLRIDYAFRKKRISAREVNDFFFSKVRVVKKQSTVETINDTEDELIFGLGSFPPNSYFGVNERDYHVTFIAYENSILIQLSKKLLNKLAQEHHIPNAFVYFRQFYTQLPISTYEKRLNLVIEEINWRLYRRQIVTNVLRRKYKNPDFKYLPNVPLIPYEYLKSATLKQAWTQSFNTQESSLF